jgi:YegS/Rv2252/BmrU family lipid kinase
MALASDICVIYNPSAGRGKSAERWRQVQELLSRRADFRPTDAAGHATELAAQAAGEGFATIVAAGGDGTVHEVMNGIMMASRPEVVFSVLPLGSGNDYARALRVPFDPSGMVERLFSSAIWPVDVGKAVVDGQRQHYFCNTLGLGLSGAVTYEAKQIRWLRGIPLYGWAALKGIVKHFHSIPIRLAEGADELTTHLLYLAVAIGQAEGGGFVVAPDARLDDGWFDILHVTKMNRLQAMTYLPRMALGLLPANCATIQRRRAQHLKIVGERPFAMHADGELLASPRQGVTECEITILPGRLKIRGSPPPVPANPVQLAL